MPTLGKVLWTVLFLSGAILAVFGLVLGALQVGVVEKTDVFLFGVGALSFFVGLYIWKTDLFN